MRRGCGFKGLKADVKDRTSELWSWRRPDGSVAVAREDRENVCPLSIVDREAVSMVDTAMMLEAGSLTFSHSEAAGMSRRFWSAVNYIKRLVAEAKSEREKALKDSMQRRVKVGRR